MDKICLLHYSIVFIILIIWLLAYCKIADKYNIIDKPTERGSHNYITIRGGGIIYWLAGVLFAIQHLPESAYFLVGLTLICGVSLWDDISSLSSRMRVVIHFLSIGIVFWGLSLYNIFPWWGIVIAFILFVGIMNAFNFMDGINGMTGLYSLATLFALQYVNVEYLTFTNPDFINYAILASIVFLFFNFRKKAKCFAGDVGSIGISFWIVILLLQLMIKTQSFVWILFLSVYGVDVVCTIIHRLYLKQNIFEPHRLHFYQILSNECKIDHRIISAFYALIQLFISFIVIISYKGGTNGLCVGLLIILPLILIYPAKFVLKSKKLSI